MTEIKQVAHENGITVKGFKEGERKSDPSLFGLKQLLPTLRLAVRKYQ